MIDLFKEQQLEKEVDDNTIPGHTNEKRQDIYQQLLTLHSDVTKVSNGVEEVESKAKEMISEKEVRNEQNGLCLETWLFHSY